MSHKSVLCPHCGKQTPPSFKYCGHCGRRVATSARALSLTALEQQSNVPILARDERRDITVLFADVTGFTSICEQLDPEDVHSVMNDCFAGLGGAIQEHGGLVDRYLGDAVMALFGAPITHENDASRACLAALAIQAFLAGFREQCKIRIGIDLQMRIGVHCGMVVVGGVGSDARLVYGARGDTMNTAARLQSAAQPGKILISREVAKRTHGGFEFGPIQSFPLKGKEESVEACELLGQKTGKSKDRAWEWNINPMVGREQELRLLLDYLRVPRTSPQWLEILGEQGIGKTRLVLEAARRLPDVRLLVVTGDWMTKAQPFGFLRLILYAVITELTGHSAQPEDRQSFSNSLRPLGDDLTPYLDVLWHLAAPPRHSVPAPDPDPLALRRTLERGIQTLLTRLTQHCRDAVLFLDSFEHADSPSVNVLQAFLSQAEEWPLRVIVASRHSGYRPPRAATILPLQPLSHLAASDMLDLLLHGGQSLPLTVRHEVLEKAGGLPLYLIEMVQALVDEGMLMPSAEGAVWVCSGRNVSLPATIRTSIAARLDRLPQTERELLCQCSVIGLEFSEEVIEYIWRKQFSQGPDLVGLLRSLAQRGIIRDVAHCRYRFCLPAMREVCYETLLARDRKAIHAATAQALRELVNQTDTVSPELLAYHYEQAEQWVQAAEANLQAGDRARSIYLNEEAIQRYKRVFDAIERISSPSQFELELKVKASARSALILVLTGKYGLAEERTLDMRRQAARSRDRAEAIRLLASVYLHTGRVDDAERLLTEALITARSDWSAGEVVAHVLYDQAELHRRTGQLEEAFERLQQCRLAVLSSEELAPMLLRIDLLEGKIAHVQGHYQRAAELYAKAYEAAKQAGSLSERASAANGLGNVTRDVGNYPAAARHFEEALQIWTQIGDCESIAGAHNNLGNVAMSQGDDKQARDHHEASLRLSQHIENIQGCGLAHTNLALLALEENNGQKALHLAKLAVDTLGKSGNTLLNALASVILGEAYVTCGDVLRAKTTFVDLLAMYDEMEHPLVVAGSSRGLGRVALMQGSYDEAVYWLQRAHQLFERLKRVQEAARTSVYLAQALWQVGKHEQARSGLQQAQERFMHIEARQDATMAKLILQDLEQSADR